jgi:hypothetical protein
MSMFGIPVGNQEQIKCTELVSQEVVQDGFPVEETAVCDSDFIYPSNTYDDFVYDDNPDRL